MTALLRWEAKWLGQGNPPALRASEMSFFRWWQQLPLLSLKPVVMVMAMRAPVLKSPVTRREADLCASSD